MNVFKTCALTMVVMALTFGVSATSPAQPENASQARGIILLIGDGMGLNQIRSADIYASRVLNQRLAIHSLAQKGITTTFSADSDITDSAAAATALYSGCKTNNGMINTLPSGETVPPIAQVAKSAGLAVGIVTTSNLTDATPAAVYSFSTDRRKEDFIAEQLPEFAPDVALGGGRKYFMPQTEKYSNRKDDKNIIQLMKSRGYEYVENESQLKAFRPEAGRKLLGLFTVSHMNYSLDRANEPELQGEPTLADMMNAALSIVEKNPKGFFLMVEGGRIDHACHAHDIKAAIYEVLAFDAAVKAALDFQKTHPDVLVIVTADHETGGLALGRGAEYALNLLALQPIKNSLEYLDKKFKKDPGDLGASIEAAGYNLTDEERSALLKGPPEPGAAGLPQLSAYRGVNKYVTSWLHYALGAIASDRAKVGWTTFAHTGQPTITSAAGPGAEQFAGWYDNTDIPKRMAGILGLSLEATTLQPGRPSGPTSSSTATGSK